MRALASLLAVSFLALAACAPEAVVSVTLTPESPELAAVLREADARWEAAGVAPERIVIGPGGAPVSVADLGAVAAGPILGETHTVGRAGVYTRTTSMKLASLDVDSAVHEIGHALGIGAASVVTHPINGAECDVDASVRPLMCPIGFGHAITGRDLGEACSEGACTHWAPEAL